MSPADLRLSVAVVTRNRPDSLDRALASLRSQPVQPYEVLVSDNSDGEYVPLTRAVVEQWDCRYLPGSQRGLASNRNRVARACEGTHVRTMDDDHALPAGHLERCLAAIASDPEAIWTTGEISFVDGAYWMSAAVANQLTPAGVGRSITNPDDNWGIADGSTTYPRAVFERGLFMLEDYEHDGNSLEYGAYLYRHGFRSRSIPDAPIEHYMTAESLHRRPPRMFESRLFASLCYNLYFRPHYVRAGRYALPYLWRLRDRHNPAQLLPTMLAAIRQRWEPLAARDLNPADL